MSQQKRKHPWLALAIGVTAGGVYSLIRGNGIFNKPRFAPQHKAVERYLDAHYPGAVYSSIKETGSGWSCVVRDGDRQFILYLTRAKDKVYIFHERGV